MRSYEALFDQRVPLGFQIIVRLDGRGFTRLTRELCEFEAPFDVRFRDMMLTTLRHLMACGFNVLYGYSESDEISLLLHPAETSFSRKVRKLISILAGEASAAFSVALGQAAAFDARLCALPGVEQVLDYFRWRMGDAGRCCLNGHAYWLLRRQGMDAQAASGQLLRMKTADMHELLFRAGINFDALPSWQKRGFGTSWVEADKLARNPITGESVLAQRGLLQTELELPWKDAYDEFLRGLLAKATDLSAL